MIINIIANEIRELLNCKANQSTWENVRPGDHITITFNGYDKLVGEYVKSLPGRYQGEYFREVLDDKIFPTQFSDYFYKVTDIRKF